MKMKKIVAGVAAAAMAVTSMAAMSVSAVKVGDTVVDFEDGDCSFVYMNDMDGGTKATIEVADFEGSKQLKVTPEDSNAYCKIWFDLDGITDRANTVNIAKITFDITVAPTAEDGIVGGWVGGEIGAAGGFDRTGANIQASQADPKWSNGSFNTSPAYDDFGNPTTGVAKGTGEKKFMLPSEKYTMTGTNPFFACMVNASNRGDAAKGDLVYYIDNIKLLDAAGNPIPLGVAPVEETTTAASEETTAAASEETTAAPEETTAAEEDADEDVAAPEEDEAEEPEETEAPETTAAEVVTTTAAADTTTAPVATGNVAVASIAAVMTVAGVAAIAAKKRK